MFTEEELKTILIELEVNCNAYLQAMRRVGLQAAKKLNVKVSKIADVLEKVKLELTKMKVIH